MSEFDLKNRVALVTGASSGLGAHFAEVLAGAGAQVVLTARREAEVKSVAARIRNAGGQAIPVMADVEHEADIASAFDCAEKSYGPVSTIVANAGVNIAGVAAVDMNVADFSKVLTTNIIGTFLTAREGARRLLAIPHKSRPAGRIVLVSSITARQVVKGLSPYSASKAAIEQMGRVLAKDWARHGVNVNMLAPGNVETEINEGWFGTEAGKRQLINFPRRRLMDTNSLDAMLLYLCADASAAVTGSVFTIDDGQSL